jgi:hypothetical protein
MDRISSAGNRIRRIKRIGQIDRGQFGSRVR